MNDAQRKEWLNSLRIGDQVMIVERGKLINGVRTLVEPPFDKSQGSAMDYGGDFWVDVKGVKHCCHPCRLLPIDPQPQSTTDNGNKYRRKITHNADGLSDIYDILHAYECTPALAHAVKKILCAGLRGSKDRLTDLREAVVSLNRAIELETQS